MQKKKITRKIIIIALIFVIYFFVAAKPVPRETILIPKWINSLETEDPIILTSGNLTAGEQPLPFILGYHFGYIDTSGHFAFNKFKSNEIGLSKNMWTEYPAQPENIEIKNIAGDTIINIENTRGYPFFLDNRIFIFGSEQNSLAEIDTSGNVKWTYEFGSILTDIDVAAGLVVAVSIDGILEILNSQGQRVFYFQPGGSRLETIYGCSISRDGSRIGIVSGYDPQRFLLLEKFGPGESEYRVIYHEFLDKGYRRSVRVKFIDDDRRVIYERQGGVSCYNIRSRKSIFIPLDGEVTAMDDFGENGRLFLITRREHQPYYKELIGINLPGERLISSMQNAVFLRAPFKSDDAYLGRTQTAQGESILIVGGGAALILFNIDSK